MRSPRLGLLARLGVAGSLLACRIDGSIGRAETGGALDAGDVAVASTGDGAGSDGAQTGAMSAGAEGTGGAGGSGEGTGASTAGGTASGESSGTDGTTVPHACMPSPDDTACAACRKASCCDPLDACVADDACTCTWTCRDAGIHTPQECATGCGYDGTALDDVHDCAALHCADECAAPLDDPP